MQRAEPRWPHREGPSTTISLHQSHLWAKVRQETHVWKRLTQVGGEHRGRAHAEFVTPTARIHPAPATSPPFTPSHGGGGGGRQGGGRSLSGEAQKQRTRPVKEKRFNKELSEQLREAFDFHPPPPSPWQTGRSLLLSPLGLQQPRRSRARSGHPHMGNTPAASPGVPGSLPPPCSTCQLANSGTAPRSRTFSCFPQPSHLLVPPRHLQTEGPSASAAAALMEHCPTCLQLPS